MSAALAAIAAVALLAIVGLVLTTRRAGSRLAAEQARVESLEAQLQTLHAAGPAAGGRDQEPAPIGDDRPAVSSEQQPTLAPTPTGDQTPEPSPTPAEQTATSSDERLTPASTADTPSPGGWVAAAPLWDLERLRLEREWADIVGPAIPLPVPWDGSVRSLVAVELEIIREVIGTPSEIQPDTPASPAEPAVAVATARLAAEVLRRLARVGEEISVSFHADSQFTMAIETEGPAMPPDLSEFPVAAAELGGQLILRPTASGFEAELRLPSQPATAS